VTPVPVDGLLSSIQLNESTPLVVLGLIALVRAVFVGVPVVIVFVALVVVALVVLALSIFAIPIVLWAGSGHHRNRCSKSSGQKKRTEILVSTVHVGLLWRETHIRRIPLTSLSALDGSKSGQYCSDVLLELTSQFCDLPALATFLRIGDAEYPARFCYYLRGVGTFHGVDRSGCPESGPLEQCHFGLLDPL
jgi:hypothetical protein